MKHVRTYMAAALVSLLALLCLVGSGLAPGGASRAGLKVVRAVPLAAASEDRPEESVDRVSPDLLELARDPEAAGRRVRVIVQERAGLDALLASTLGREVKTRGRFDSLGARVVELPARLVERLSEQKGVRFLSPDRETTGFGHVSRTTGTDDVRETSGTNVNGLDGTGIGIAILDSGIDKGHTAFLDKSNGLRVVYSKDFTGEGRTDDPFGHGTHVASIAAGNGRISRAEYVGVAPNANIVNLRVLNSQGMGRVSYILGALEWVYQNRAAYNIRVVNLSLGTAAVESYKNDPVCKAVRKLVDAGVVVVAAAGNNGKDAAGQKVYGAIHSPGSEPSAITVGASNSFGTDKRSDDGIASYSSRGPTRGGWTDALGVRHHDNLIKPDLVAPGNKIVNAEAEDNLLVTQHPELDAGVSPVDARRMMFLNGTSMATPAVAGAAALLLQANPTLTPNLVKTILMYTSQQLPGFNMLEQGAGELNVEGAVRLAKLVRRDLSALTPLGAPLLTSAAPTPQTTIAGETFTWSQGIVIEQGYATGVELIVKYQKIYGLGVLATDAIYFGDGVLATDRTFLSSGVLATDNVLVSNGQILGSGTVFLASGVLATDRFVVASGVLATDRTLFGDGVLATDGTLDADAAVQALSAATSGDATRGALPVPETGLDCLDYK
ncbi:MAG: serine protease AprX [Acidobacteriota bacterium]|nr:serine protease AprX [Acidobacteriota bacterium]